MFYHVARTMIFILFNIIFRIKITGKEHLKSIQGTGAIIAANHKSNFDPLVLGASIAYKLHFMAKEELYKIPVLKQVLLCLETVPVKRGSGDLGAIKASLSILKNHELLAMFPEGRRVRASQTDADNSAKAGIAFLAIKAKVPIVPVSISSKYHLFSKVTVKIGEPLAFSSYYGNRLNSEQLNDISSQVMDTIYKL